MSNTKIKIMLLLIILTFSSVFSNGGPIDGSNILNTGNIDLIKVDNVELISESIYIYFDQDYVDVEVIYFIKNNGLKQIISYGFPLEFSNMQYLPEDSILSDIEIPYFYIFDEEVSLPIKEFIENDSFVYEIPDGYEVTAYRKWYIIELNIDENEIKRIKISYRVKVLYEDFVTTKHFLPGFSHRFFKYVLDPAGNWSDGFVENFYVCLNFKMILENQGRIISLPEGGYWFQETCYILKKSDFNLSTSSPIEVLYNIDTWKIVDYYESYLLPDEYLKSINISSVLPELNGIDYDKSNLFDGDYTTAWVEGSDGQGIGEWIEIELDNFSIGYISILNGYTKSEQTYFNNARIKKIEYILYINTDNPYNIYNEMYCEDSIYGSVELDDIVFQDINENSFLPMNQFIYMSRDGGIPVKKIKFRILDVYPGTKYQDLCISEIFILGYKLEDIIR